MTASQPTEQLSEAYIQDSFHSYLKSSLTQAKLERLLDEDVLSSAEGDLMITGPALCLYFAALRCTTTPPSVPLPRLTKDSPPLDLSPSNCPPAFVSFLQVWSDTVPSIQSLTPEYQHDLARVICNLEPLTQPVNPALNGIAADLRAVAIDISQRRSFQDRYADDLQAAIDAGETSGRAPKVRASFVPPPVYDPSPTSSAASSPRSTTSNLPHPQPGPPVPAPQSPGLLSPFPPPTRSRSPSPTLISPDSPAIQIIRETLYASLADALERTPSLRDLLKRDPPRAYFASVAYAILDVATTAMTADGNVVGILGKELTKAECPPALRPFMSELAAIGRQANDIEMEDTELAMKYAQAGREIPPPRMERVKMLLEGGVGYERARNAKNDTRKSVEGRAVTFANRINALSLHITEMKVFKERQAEVFKILAGIGSK